jgi:hypothetical protein
MSSFSDYLLTLNRLLWAYAEAEGLLGRSLLDRDQRTDSRPPVFKKLAASRNIIMRHNVPPELRIAVERSLPVKERHRWFRSMKSSQALAQSVFGNLLARRELGLLRGLKSDQGLLAISSELEVSTAQLEFTVGYLGEPRATSADFWVDGTNRVAVECKLAEADFGTCSRPRLREGRDDNYHSDHCDGNYVRQRGRTSRCSLTEIGVAYWEYVPELFDWPNDRDLCPCPVGITYQLVRNILAASVKPDGQLETSNAHVLVIYDARNPSFQNGGTAHAQWSKTRAALKDPNMLRSCSWQSLIHHLEQGGKLPWLVDALRHKYGI